MSVPPLAGRRILVTRAREQSSTLAAGLRVLGAEVLEVPTIRIVPPASYAPLDAALARLPAYDVLLVTSANTAAVLAGRVAGVPAQQPWTVAVGPATAAALRESGWRVDSVPVPAVAESIVRELAPSAAGKRMLLARAEVARDILPDSLREAGAAVDVVDAYRTELAEASRVVLTDLFSPNSQVIDAVTFTSSSTVRNLWLLLGREVAAAVFRTTPACSIGPITSGTLREHDVEPACEAAAHDVAGLLAAVQMLLQRDAPGRS